MQIINKSANFNFQLIGDPVEAGISLKGFEARSLRTGRGDLSAAFIKLIDGELFLVNANIPASGVQNYDPAQSRKLLLHKKEIISLSTKSKQQKLQIVPISLYNKQSLARPMSGKQSLMPGGKKSRLIKLKLCLGKPKREFEKRDAVKKRDIKRELQEALKSEIRNSKS